MEAFQPADPGDFYWFLAFAWKALKPSIGGKTWKKAKELES